MSKKKPVHTQKIHTFLFSDLHLGSKASRPKALKAEMEKYDFEVLIINGDLFQNANLKRLKKAEWEFLEYLAELRTRGVKEIIIRGNHDKFLLPIAAAFGFMVYKEYSWQFEGKTCSPFMGTNFTSS